MQITMTLTFDLRIKILFFQYFSYQILVKES